MGMRHLPVGADALAAFCVPLNLELAAAPPETYTMECLLLFFQ
jgi:hypothetical protein